jgi:hypothetical protein
LCNKRWLTSDPPDAGGAERSSREQKRVWVRPKLSDQKRVDICPQ